MEEKVLKNEKATTSGVSEENDDNEWEETTLVVTVDGVLDADLVRDAVKRNLVNLRYPETENPVLQINNTLYSTKWDKDLGTNIVLQTTGNDQMEVISCTSTMLQAEKALLTSVELAETSIGAEAEQVPKSSLTRTQTRRK